MICQFFIPEQGNVTADTNIVISFLQLKFDKFKRGFQYIFMNDGACLFLGISINPSTQFPQLSQIVGNIWFSGAGVSIKTST
jgi:hypothetical protein